MSSVSIYLAILSVIISLFYPVSLSFPQQDDAARKRAKEILRQVDDMWRGASSHTIFSMQVKAAHYTRSIRLEGWSKGKEKTLVRILTPLKEKGTATLKSGNSIYSYLPRTDRTIRLTSGMMMGSWMGSHFTNDDLVKESRMEEDYDPTDRTIRLTSGMMMGSWMGSHFTNDDLVKESRMEEDYDPTISFEGKRDNQSVIEFTLIPKEDAAVVWGKVVVTVLAEGYLPIVQYYYDEDMNIARTMLFSENKLLGGRQLPSVMRVVPADKPNEYTELVYEKLELDIKLSDAFFSLARLKRM